MDISKELLTIINQARIENQKLNINQTLKIITAYRAISNNPELIGKLIHLIECYVNEESYSKLLTARQNQIFNLIGLEFSSREIASVLSISEATVSTHRKNIIKKLRLSGKGKLQRIAYEFLIKNTPTATI